MKTEDIIALQKSVNEQKPQEAKHFLKAHVIAALAPSIFQPADYAWYDNDQREKDADADGKRMREAWEKIREDIRAENIRRAVTLADQLAEAAFGEDSAS